VKVKSNDRGIAWERFFDAVQAEAPQVLKDLRRVALEPFIALLRSSVPQHSKLVPLGRVIEDAATFRYTNWSWVNSSTAPAAKKLANALEDWAERHRLPQLRPQNKGLFDVTLEDWAKRNGLQELPPQNNALFGATLEMLLGMCTGRKDRLPWALPRSRYLAARLGGSREARWKPVPILAVAPMPEPGEDKDAYVRRASAINERTFLRAWARLKGSVDEDAGTSTLPYRAFVRHRILGEKLDAVAADHHVSPVTVRRWFKDIEAALDVHALRSGRPRNLKV
jgi:hypothetical protein